MRTFRLGDAEFAALAAGRPTAATLGELRRAQLSRHLLLLSELVTLPSWYGEAGVRGELADPMNALHTAALRSGASPPPRTAGAGRRLTPTCDGLTLRVRLEDADPIRGGLGLTPVDRLDDEAFAGWARLLDEAWRILVTRHRPDAATMAAVLSVIVPVEPDPGAAGISATSADAYGAVAISAPADPAALAVGLLHETQHSLLNAVRTLFDLVVPSPQRGYSPWRDDPRPSFGILHGAYAYQAVTRFWRAEAAAARPGAARRLAGFEFARWRAAVVGAADCLLAGTLLTAAGRRFTGALRNEVAAWLGEPVDPDVARLAEGANTDHRVRWRLRNLAVDPATVSALAGAWRSGSPAPATPASQLRPAPTRRLEQSTRLALVHSHLRDPSLGAEPDAGSGPTRPEGDQSRSPGGGVRPGADAGLGEHHGTRPAPYLPQESGDAAYLAGDDLAALAAYRREIAAGEMSLDVWGGLALVAPPAALRERPELVRAAWLELDAPDPLALAEWLG